MKKLLFPFFLLFCGSVGAQAPVLPKVSSGRLLRLEQVPSRFVDARNVDVWLPEGYSPRKKYPVLYMHDGQMLYDATTTWNKQAWEVDDVASALIREKKLPPFIVVGVWNGGNSRHVDYFPQKPFESLTAAQQDSLYSAARSTGASVFNSRKVQSDNYLKFLVQELKPRIDSQFATRPGRAHTFVAGSSMGGLISMYALCEYPEVFGGAACLSTHWPGTFTVENNPIPDAFVRYLEQNLPDPKKHRLYFDLGTATLDSLYPPLQEKVDAVVRARGYTAKNWSTRVFEGEDHSEKAWNKRLDLVLGFLLKGK